MNYDYIGIWIQMAIVYVFGSGFVFPLAAEFVSVWKSFILKNAKLNFFPSSFYPKEKLHL